MASQAYSVAVLTVSDTAYLNRELDRSGPLISQTLGQHYPDSFTIDHQSILPDDPSRISAAVTNWIDQLGVRLVITTGGTGFGLRDTTPEAIAPLITRQTPALTHALTSYSLTKTPLAALSRLVTGIREPPTSHQATSQSLIVTLPGSSKAVKECLDVLLGSRQASQPGPNILLHALDLLCGGSGSEVHKSMGAPGYAASPSSLTFTDRISTSTDTGQAHTCGRNHGHLHSGLHVHQTPRPRTVPSDRFKTHDFSAGPTFRHRTSPYPIITLDEALSLIDKHTSQPDQGLAATVLLPVNSSLAGFILAEDIVAATDLPPGPTTNVDGYAVKAKGSGTPAGDYHVVTMKDLLRRETSATDKQSIDLLKEGEVFRINTGQGLPEGTDAVVMVEDTELLECHEEYVSESQITVPEEKKIRILAQVEVGENVRPKASDVQKGSFVLRRGTLLSPLGGEIGTLAFVGRTEVRVFKKPKVAILSTGNELVDVQSRSKAQSEAWGFTVYDANRPGLAAAVEGLGFQVIDLGIVGDDDGATEAALQKGLSEADVVITTGGTSMGESDLLKPLIERKLGGDIHFGRVAMKPGKPTTFASVRRPSPSSSESGTDSTRLLFALPGNPASALVCFYVFVLPALRKMSGLQPSAAASLKSNPWSLPRAPVLLSSPMKLDPRPEFHRSVVHVEGSQLVAYSTGSQRSSGMHSMATANALVCVPALSSEPGSRKQLEAGEQAVAILIGPLV
ncbi:hypothetical protein IE53DRAFT_328863 [Violaceomyces palustris]|uniref:Uncharacterized protein n=1 Tax=Violaceomyces palustris TaxID=1673888 RepID=A0ACD0NZD3_9BASI|nr:hypothetical protein IE53DRAFT_328863 [Violaceomyces palustris]